MFDSIKPEEQTKESKGTEGKKNKRGEKEADIQKKTSRRETIQYAT